MLVIPEYSKLDIQLKVMVLLAYSRLLQNKYSGNKCTVNTNLQQAST